MVMLRTFSQVKSFLKRNKKRVYYHREGCGCCSNSGSLAVDVKKSRILFVDCSEHKNSVSIHVTVLAVAKKRRRQVITDIRG
jgi:hypothetical protein